MMRIKTLRFLWNVKKYANFNELTALQANVRMYCYLHPRPRVTEITPQVPLQVVPISVRSEAEGTNGTTSKGTRGVISVTRGRGWR